MHPLTKRIAVLLSVFCLVLGLFLLGYNLMLIPQRVISVALALWPLVLIVAGVLLIVDTLKKRRFTRSAVGEAKEYPLPLQRDIGELRCKVSFSYGRLHLGASSRGTAVLVAEQIGPMAAPTILREERGAATILNVTMNQPLFPSYFQLLNTWYLNLPRDIPLYLEVRLHEANLSMDLRQLRVESIDVHADSGKQEIFIGGAQKKLSGQIYSSSTDLSIVLPARVYVQVKLLNPFCRVDYPQGDLERREDGSFVSTAGHDAHGSVDISIDGPIRNLILDMDDTEPVKLD